MEKKHSGVGLVLILTVLLTLASSSANAAFDELSPVPANPIKVPAGTASIFSFEENRKIEELGCQMRLLTPSQLEMFLDNELKRLISEMGWFQEIIAKLRSNRILQQVKERCLPSVTGVSSCSGITEEEVTAILKEVLTGKTTFQPMRNLIYLSAGNAIFAGITSGAASILIQSNFIELFIPQFMAQAGFIGVMMLSPFSEPLNAIVRRLAYLKLSTDPEADFSRLNSAHPLTDQQITSRFFELAELLRSRLKDAKSAYKEGNRIIPVLAFTDALIIVEEKFREYRGFEGFAKTNKVNPMRELLNVVQIAFILNFPNESEAVREELVGPVLREVKNYYVGRGDTVDMEYVNGILQAWLTPIQLSSSK